MECHGRDNDNNTNNNISLQGNSLAKNIVVFKLSPA